MTALPRTFAWFVAAAIFWGGVDLIQVALFTGGQRLGALSAVVLGLYVAVGATAAICVAPLLSRRHTHGRGAVVTAALLLPGAALAAAHVNFVHLPDFLTPITIATNVALAVTTTAAVWIVARSRVAERLADWAFAPLFVAALGVVLAVARRAARRGRRQWIRSCRRMIGRTYSWS
jgi:hypothetical protein